MTVLYEFPFPNCLINDTECITSYTISEIPNEISFQADKYNLKRKEFTDNVFTISIKFQDMLTVDFDIIHDFYRQKSKSIWFYMHLDSKFYIVRFLSYYYDYSTLYDRKNVNISLIGKKANHIYSQILSGETVAVLAATEYLSIANEIVNQGIIELGAGSILSVDTRGI